MFDMYTVYENRQMYTSIDMAHMKTHTDNT